MGEIRSDRRGMARPTFEPDSAGPMPRWLKVPLRAHQRFSHMKKLVHEAQLHTVCESANCPNIGECWSRGAVTFMILGSICTRSCGFCDVATGRPAPPDAEEPQRLADSLAALKLRYAVITSVDRDDLPDAGADFWARTIRAIRATCPDLEVEALVPDFRGMEDSIRQVVEAAPHVLAHNIETVARLHRQVRPQARYERSLSVIHMATEAGAMAKSGLMVGLGESDQEVEEALRDLHGAGCTMVSIGQYLRPSPRHLPVRRWVTPEMFEHFASVARSLGFRGVASAPLVRSSYRADELAAARSTDETRDS
jgi:lipoyl synthase